MTIIPNYLKKERFFLLSSCLALFSLVSCQKQPVLNFGSQFISDNNGANIVLVDTASVFLSTVYSDSTATAGTGYLQIGEFRDPYFGTINSRAFMQVAPPSPIPTITVNDGYDSIGLILLFKKGNPYYGDTTVSQSISINQVSTLYQLNSFQRGFFSNSSFPVDPVELGRGSATIAPNIPYTDQGFGDTVKIKMNDQLGLQLFNMIYNKSDTITKSADWLAWFHGLCLSATPGTRGAIFGFQDSAIMRIYYHQAAAYTAFKFIDFNVTNRGFQFNNIVTDWTGSPLAKVTRPGPNPQTPPATPSDSTDHAAYIQTMTGLNVKMTFPYLSGISARADYLSILRAELTVRPIPESFGTTQKLPPQMGIYQTDHNNLIGSPLVGSLSGSGGIQTGNLDLDYLSPLNTSYTYDVTNFVKYQILNNSTTSGQNGLMLSIPFPAAGNSFLRAALTDQTYPVKQRIRLSVYYISLYPHK
ncbi:DUF4270 family protein [Flavitalea flava]